jgi:hypothetical protein
VWTAPRRCCTRSLCSPSAPSPPRSSISRTSSRTIRRSSSSLNSEYHRVDRVPAFYPVCRNWLSPAPSPASECCPPLWFQGGDTLACWRGGGEASSDDWTDTPWYSRYSIIPLRLVHTYLIVYVFNICSCTFFTLYFPSVVDPIQIRFWISVSKRFFRNLRFFCLSGKFLNLNFWKKFYSQFYFFVFTYSLFFTNGFCRKGNSPRCLNSFP